MGKRMEKNTIECMVMNTCYIRMRFCEPSNIRNTAWTDQVILRIQCEIRRLIFISICTWLSRFGNNRETRSNVYKRVFEIVKCIDVFRGRKMYTQILCYFSCNFFRYSNWKNVYYNQLCSFITPKRNILYVRYDHTNMLILNITDNMKGLLLYWSLTTAAE